MAFGEGVAKCVSAARRGKSYHWDCQVSGFGLGGSIFELSVQETNWEKTKTKQHTHKPDV